jgi:phenylalanyl-tRNA synthetase beta chain
VGAVFRPVDQSGQFARGGSSGQSEPDDQPGQDSPMVEEPERLSVVFSGPGDDAWSAVAAWRTIASGLRLDDWMMEECVPDRPAARVLHPFRSSMISGVVTAEDGDGRKAEHATELGVVGELDPGLVTALGLVGADGRPRRIGWLDLDLDVVLDHVLVPRAGEESRPISVYPSSDVDLAFVVDDSVLAGSVERTLHRSGGTLLESVELFDVYRGTSVPDGARSLAYRLRFCALDRTLTDQEVGALRASCIEEVQSVHGATLR